MYPEKENTLGRVGKIPHLQGETEALAKSVEELNAQTEQLHSRLSSVLRIQPESAEKSVGVPEDQLVPAADNIRSIRRGVDNSNYVLRSILSRLEI